MPTIAEVISRRLLTPESLAGLRSVGAGLRAVGEWLEEHREAWLPLLANLAVSLDELRTHQLAPFVQLDERLVGVLVERGWYPDTRMAPASLALLSSCIDEDPCAIDEIMQDVFRERLANIEARLAGEYPERSAVLRDAFWAHRASRYNLSIPVFLSQADGIWCDRINRNLFHNGTSEAIQTLLLQVSDPNARELIRALDTSGWPLAMSKGRRPSGFTDLNRHQVLHGEDIGYGTEINSLKAASFINYCAFMLSQAQ